MNQFEINTITNKLSKHKIKNIVHIGSVFDRKSKNYILFYEEEGFVFNIFLDIHVNGSTGNPLSHATKIEQIDRFVEQDKNRIRKILFGKIDSKFLANSHERIEHISNHAHLLLDNLRAVRPEQMEYFEKHETLGMAKRLSHYTDDPFELFKEVMKKSGYATEGIEKIVSKDNLG